MISRLRNHIASLADPQQRVYFFGNLQTPRVFEDLRRLGVFKSPPPVRIEAGRTLAPVWPQARYLINVAGEIPEKVANVIQSVETDNPAVMMDLLRAALKMPPEIAKTVVTRMQQWVSAEGRGLLIYPILDMIDLLASKPETRAAFRLAGAVLGVKPDTELVIESLGYRKTDAVPVIGGQHFSFALDRMEKTLTTVDPYRMLRAIQGSLDESLRIEGLTSNRDFSSIWLPRLGGDVRTFGAKGLLAKQLYLTAHAVIEKKLLSFHDVLEVLGRSSSDIYHRIRLALIADFEEYEYARGELVSKAFYQSPDLRPERATLLRAFYPRLDPKEQRVVIQHLRDDVTSEPTVRKHLAHRLEGQELDRAVIEVRDHELFTELSAISAFLVTPERDEYEALKARFETENLGPEDDEVWVGPTAPQTNEQLQAMSSAELLGYLTAWTPKSGWFQPTPEGLGRAIEPIVESRLSEFLHLGSEIRQLDPTYVRHIVTSLRKHVHLPDFDPEAFVSILEYVVDRECDAAAGAFDPGDSDEGSSWSNLLQIVAFAVSDLLRTKTTPLALRERLWAVLEVVLRDPDPSMEADAKYDLHSSYGPPWQLALNSARGAGMLAVFDYARWLYAAAGGKSNDVELAAEAPEVFATIDVCLNAELEPTRAVRSTVGTNFVSLFAMSKAWTRGNVDRIFSQDRFGDAAWDSYLAHNAAYDETFAALVSQYTQAIRKMPAEEAPPGAWGADVVGNLGIHLTTAYVRGHLSIAGTIVEEYFRSAPSSAIGTALTSLGNALATEREALPKAIAERCQEVYDFILSIIVERPEETRLAALGGFGIWFQSTQLPDDWLLDRLLITLRRTRGKIAWEGRVLERLAELSPAHPREVVEALRDLTFGSPSNLFLTEDSIEKILKNAVQAGGQARQIAIRTNDRIVNNMGILRFNVLFG